MARALLMVLALFLAGPNFAVDRQADAQETRFFRIGTGGVAGTYYPIGGLIADIISNPPGSRPCSRGGSCGVPGLVAVAQSALGSVANAEAVQAGEIESAFVQSDIAYWAFTGTGIFEGEPKASNLRAIANLYPESIHLVARKGAGITSVKDLAGKRVSLDEAGSGTLVEARILLQAFGVKESDLQAEYLQTAPSIAKMRKGQLDAFFTVAGYPAKSVVDLSASVGAELVPLIGPEVEKVLERYDFLEPDTIPAGTYKGIGAVPTLSVSASWLVGAEIDAELVYGITTALWHQNARRLLDEGHAKGRQITAQTALDGLAVPLHPGAERFYRERGLYN